MTKPEDATAAAGGSPLERGVGRLEVKHEGIDMETPKPMQGPWTLKRPDGKCYVAESPIACLRFELTERVPAQVALARIWAAADDDPDGALLRRALDALEYHRAQTRPIQRTEVAIDALRKRLARHEQPNG